MGDGLTTVKGMAVTLAMLYRIYAKDYQVYVFSRKNHMQEGYSTRDMAKDQARAMKLLGITKAKVLGISQGGMIAQYLAIDFPDLVEKLILVVTLSKQNENIQRIAKDWIALAEQNNYKQLMIGLAIKNPIIKITNPNNRYLILNLFTYHTALHKYFIINAYHIYIKNSTAFIREKPVKFLVF